MPHSRASIFLAGGLLAGASLLTSSCSDPESQGASCGLPDSVPADVPEFDGRDCPGVVAPTFAELQEGFLCYCTGCHSSEISGGKRGGAPSGIDYDTYAGAQAAAHLGVANVLRRLMPYPDGQGPTNAERNLFYQWVYCGMPQ